MKRPAQVDRTDVPAPALSNGQTRSLHRHCCKMGVRMFRRTFIATALAGLIGILLVSTDAMARGGGSFRAGGFHASRSFIGTRFHRAHWGSPRFHHMSRHGARWHDNRRRHESRHHDPRRHDSRHHDPRRHDHHADRRGRHGDSGHWHTSRGFGDRHNQPPRMDGQWRRAGGFGGTQDGSRGSDGEWRVERPGSFVTRRSTKSLGD
jgi:hypothetical protein